ncbi:MAG: YfhO family protein, partial [Acutalibacteraceae bacterium]
LKDYDIAPRQKETKDGKKVNLKRDCFFRSKFVRSGALFASSSILAAALTAFALIPTYYILQACSATSGTMPQTLENYNNIFDFLANHLASVGPTIRSSGDTVIPNVYSGLLTVILIPLYLMCKKISVKEKAATTALLGVFFACFNFNIPNFIIHAFHFPNDLPFRFSFIYSFLLIITAYKALIHIKDFTGKELLGVGISVLAFIILTEKLGQGNVELVTVAISVIFTVVYVLVLWLMKNPSYYQPTVALLLMCCVFAEAAISDTNRFEITQLKPNFVNGYSEFRTMKEDLDSREGNDHYRLELTNINTLMDNCWFGYNGVSVFSSMAYEKLANLQDNLGIKSNYINSYVYHLQTPVYNAMMSLKYIVDNNSSEMNTDLYDYVSSTGSFSSYKNKYYLPIAYSVNSDLKEWDTSDNEDPFKVQNDYWTLASGTDGKVFKRVSVSDAELTNLNDIESSFVGTQFHYSKIDGSSTANASVSYVLGESGNFYTYVDSKAFEEITVSCGDFSQSQDISEPYILDLGYHEQGEVITIDMPISPDYVSGNIDCYVYKLNEDVFREGYDILSNGAMQISEFTDTTIKGTVNVSEGGMLYTSIPYDEGWSVTVDGKPAEITDIADHALLAVETGAGEHEVEFTYHAKGLAQGAVISGAALIFAILFIIINKLRKRRVKSPAPRPVPTAEEENKVTGIDALMAQDLGPDATAEDSEALLNPEREIVIEELTEEDSAETPASDEQPSEPTENDGTKDN